MFNRHDLSRNQYMLNRSLNIKGYDWWWHSFTAYHEKTGEERSFFIEYYLCNPAYGRSTPVFGQLPENQKDGDKPSYLMVKAGCWGREHKQLHRFFAWKHVRIAHGTPYAIEAEDCYASENLLKGNVEMQEAEVAAHPEYMSDAGSMEWDLRLDKQITFNVGYGAGQFFRAMKAFEMYWHAEGMKTQYSGYVILDGERYLVKPETSYGYADKNWGRDFTSPWVWLSSNDLVSRKTGKRLENSVFDIGGGRPKIYSWALDRKLLGAFYYEGAEYEFNFSKFWMLSKTKFSCKETEHEIQWDVVQQTWKAVLHTEVKCRKEDMLWINYEAPDGMKRHNRLWNGGNGVGRVRLYRKVWGRKILVDDMDAGHVGCEYGEYEDS
ncbi:MAG: hypothetical protein Q4G60_15540 [bacterium]|nr:hypothetical protein [bacterium]